MVLLTIALLSVCSNSSCKDCLFDDKYVVPLGGSIEADLYTGNEPFHQGVAKAKGLSPADPLDPLIQALEEELQQGLSFTRKWFDSFYASNGGSNVVKNIDLKELQSRLLKVFRNQGNQN